MSVHYCIIARDNDMIVFENLVNKELSKSYKTQIKEILEEMDSLPEQSRPDFETNKLPNKMKILTYFSVVYFCCVVDSSY